MHRKPSPSRRVLLAALLGAAAVVGTSLPAHAQGKPPIKVGLITPLTGPLGSYGKSQEMMVKLAVEDVNAAGGINGSKLQVDIGDSQTDPGQAVLLFRKYFNDGYFGVVGPMTGTQWETVSPLANQLNIRKLFCPSPCGRRGRRPESSARRTRRRPTRWCGRFRI